MEKGGVRVAIVSSDTDLLPALQIVRGAGIDISYVSFSGQTTVSLAKIANHVVTLKDSDIVAAYIDSLN